MSIKLGNTEINKVYLGSSQIYRMYLGVKLFFSKLFDFSDFNVAVNSNKWVVGEDGLLTEVLAGDLPYTYINGYGQLLVEEESSIVSRNSNALNSYSKINATVTYEDLENPTGSLGTWKIQATGIDQPRIESSFNLPITDTYYTLSVFVKKGNNNFVALSRFAPTEYAIFDLELGVVLSHSTDFASIKELGNGWYRISATSLVLTSYAYNIWKLNVTNGINYYDSNIGDYFYAYGFQVETKEFYTSYVPTGSSVVTRLADNISVTPPAGVTEITETINGVDNVITTIPTTYTMPIGLIDKITMK